MSLHSLKIQHVQAHTVLAHNPEFRDSGKKGIAQPFQGCDGFDMPAQKVYEISAIKGSSVVIEPDLAVLVLQLLT
jgi:hypothetical protein